MKSSDHDRRQTGLRLVGAALSQQGITNAEVRANAVFLDACAEAAVNVLRKSQGLAGVELDTLKPPEQELARAMARAVLSEANRQITES